MAGTALVLVEGGTQAFVGGKNLVEERHSRKKAGRVRRAQLWQRSAWLTTDRIGVRFAA
jgi:hypothetical protein